MLYALTIVVPFAQTTLRLCKPLLGRLPKPLSRLETALLDAVIMIVMVAQATLRIGKPLLGRLPIAASE